MPGLPPIYEIDAALAFAICDCLTNPQVTGGTLP